MNSTIKGIISKLGGSALALANALLAIVNSVLYIHIFGVSRLSDAVYYCLAIMSAFCLLPRFLIEQFLQYYSDYRCREAEKASLFLGLNIVAMIICGILLIVCFGLFAMPLIRLLYPQLDPMEMKLLLGLLQAIKYQLGLTGVMALFQSLLVSYGKIAQIYWGRILNTAILLIGQVLIMLSIFEPPEYVRFIVLADCATTVMYFMLNWKIVAQAFGSLKNIGWEFLREQKKYVADSFIVRFGHNMQDFFLPLITSTFWSGFPGNMATCYGYANKFSSAVQMVLINPSQLENQYEISGAVSRGEENQIHTSIKSYLRLYVPLVAVSCGLCLALIPPVIHLINRAVGTESIQIIVICFCFLSLLTIAQCISVPFDTTIAARKKGKYFIIANTLYIGIVTAFVYCMPAFFYSLLIANIVAQLAALAIYALETRKLISIQRKGEEPQ